MDAPEKESVHASCCIRMEEIAKSVIVRADDFQHLIENLFHLPHQRELGAGAVEVVIRASNMEIMVALQIVSQKTDRKSTLLNSSHMPKSRMPSSA